MNSALVRAAGEQLQAAQRVLIVSHIRPDGDAVGSLLGLGLTLQAKGKEVQMVIADGVPPNFRYLEGSDAIRKRAQGSFDFIAVVDCSDLGRTGGALDNLPAPTLNVDHHVTNTAFAALNLVDLQAVATAEVLADLLAALDLELTRPAADALLTGMVTDTLGFRTSNITPKALRLAADLMEKGANLPDLYQQALINRSYQAVQFWGAGLKRLEREGNMIWTVLTQADRKEFGYPGRDDADLINILSSINEAGIAIIFVEQPNGRVKVSWRAQPEYDVSQVALSFGGGGHPAASGAEIEGNLEQVKATVLSATRLLLEEPLPE